MAVLIRSAQPAREPDVTLAGFRRRVTHTLVFWVVAALVIGAPFVVASGIARLFDLSDPMTVVALAVLIVLETALVIRVRPLVADSWRDVWNFIRG